MGPPSFSWSLLHFVNSELTHQTPQNLEMKSPTMVQGLLKFSYGISWPNTFKNNAHGVLGTEKMFSRLAMKCVLEYCLHRGICQVYVKYNVYLKKLILILTILVWNYSFLKLNIVLYSSDSFRNYLSGIFWHKKHSYKKCHY